nr:unnamed protein product [Digitaria exilis]
MDSTTLPCLLLPLPSLQRRPNRLTSDHDRPGSSRSWPWRVKTGSGAGRKPGRFCAKGLFGGGGGGDGFRTVMRMVKLNSAIQNRSVRELLELIGDECLYFLGNLPSIDVSQLGKETFLLLHALMNLDAVIFTIVNKVLPEGTLDEKRTSTTISCVIIGLVVMVLFYALFKNL